MSGQVLDYSVLVVGSGSIGRRHLRNLRKIGIQHLAACDADQERLAPMVTELNVKPFSDFDEALASIKPELVFICTPPIFHVPQALKAVRVNAHVFIEKPLSHTLDAVAELITEAESRRRVVQVGYNLRFHPGLLKVKQLVDEGTIGRVLWAYAEVGQYLPDWRPWQDYRQSYTARRDLGGGIILDGSHELDYVIWLLGRPIELICMAGKVSNLIVNVEDCATILLRFENGTQADIHMDFVQRGYARLCKLAGEKGTIVWDYSKSEVQIFRADGAGWETISYEFDPNQTYIAEVEHFLARVTCEDASLVSLKESYQTLQVALAAHCASQRRKVICIDYK
ncbi:Gfo/Idh/MocA family protein [Acetomicrobium sp. S15 = DSM 107314]|uniref:Gfo/Idh/MocA family protein n=1 Tax=Acetomicrobium sp. S15 = DSM 107314 TaxID=2529858 RepID=UPI0018E198A0|nr:Gfo/Idh/MocA family oxidoreductase [Acetomicrobium sp. S15 = DSM 107314]